MCFGVYIGEIRIYMYLVLRLYVMYNNDIIDGVRLIIMVNDWNRLFMFLNILKIIN